MRQKAEKWLSSKETILEANKRTGTSKIKESTEIIIPGRFFFFLTEGEECEAEIRNRILIGKDAFQKAKY